MASTLSTNPSASMNPYSMLDFNQRTLRSFHGFSQTSFLSPKTLQNVQKKLNSTISRQLPLVASASTSTSTSTSRQSKSSGKPGIQEKRRREKPQKSSGSQSSKDEDYAKTHTGKLAAMRAFEQDENLLFSPVPPVSGALRCIYAYPSEYTVGICSLGYQIMWRHLAASPDVQVARLFTDASEPLMRDPEVVGFSLSWELDYANVLSLLEEVGVGPTSDTRGESDPIVFGGGPVLSANPEPYAGFFDVVLLGDGEELLGNFLEAVRATRGAPGGGRRERLIALSGVPGVYVPSLYSVEYHEADGSIRSISTVDPRVPPTISKQTYRGDNLAVSSVVSAKMAWENIFMVEVVRSCPEMCRFCLASYGTLPFRPAPVDTSLLPAIQEGMRYTDRIGLLGASVTQHPQFEALLEYLLQPQFSHIRLSIASVRTNTVTLKLASALAQSGTKSLTVAVESGSERVRKIVNKKLATDEILAAAINAQEGGLEKLKLYGMVGLPGEEEEDILETVELLQNIRKVAPKLKLSLGCSTFVPKAHTPFQWYGVSKDGDRRLNQLASAMRKLGVDFRPESYKWSIIQALLSRGDRRLGPILELVRSFGDSKGSFRRAFKELKGQLPAMEYYVHRQVPIGEVLPWSHLKGALSEQTLVKHAAEAASHFKDEVA